MLRVGARIWTVLIGVALSLVLGGLAARVLLPLLPLSQRPHVLAATPIDGSVDVPPRSSISIEFNGPVNRRSVERALRIEPLTAGDITWSEDGRTLRFTPVAPLRPAITYTLNLGVGASSRFFQPLAAPFSSTFRTAPAPIVGAALPTGGSTDPDTPVALVFSRPMVPPEVLGVAGPLPQLRFEPPVSGSARWIDPSTLLFHPEAPLLPATSYRATLESSLTDLSGSPLGQDYVWNFSTSPPRLLARSPAPDAQDVGPDQPLLLELSQQISIDAIEGGLRITPPISGNFTSALSGTGQLISFTPSSDWEPETTYQVALPQLPPSVGDLPLPAASWSFRTAPRPALIGRFPGQGQLLPRGQAIRLIFSAPMDPAALRAGLLLDPPADALDLGVIDTEVRLIADLRPATAYTLTLTSVITDRNGVALDRPYQLRFLTAPAPPTMSLPTAVGRFLNLPAGQSSAIPLQRTNIAAISGELYQLDDATLLRASALPETDWRDFSPARYGLPLLRSWRVPLNDDPAGQSVTSPLPIDLDAAGASSGPLPPGGYYLRLRSDDGPRADLLLLVSAARLILQDEEQYVVVWASDAVAATPLAGLPLALYEGSSLVASGNSDASGLWVVQRQRRQQSSPYLVLASDPSGVRVALAVSRMTPQRRVPEATGYRLALFTDQSEYAPGAKIAVGGFVRQLATGTLGLPSAGTALQLTLQPVGSSTVLTRATVLPGRSGVISASLALGAAPPGEYVLHASVGATDLRLPLLVHDTRQRPFAVDFTSVATDSLQLRATTSSGLPIAGAGVVWQLTGEPQDIPPSQGFSFGDDEQPTALPLVVEGRGATGDDGVLSLPLPAADLFTRTLRLGVRAVVQEPGGLSIIRTFSLNLPASNLQLGLRAPTVATVDEQPRLELLVSNPDDSPAPGTALLVEVLRRSWEGSPPTLREVQVQQRRLTSDAQGRAELELALDAAGEYRLVATAGSATSSSVRSARSIWLAAAPAGSGSIWRDDKGLLLADRPIYRPGDTARLLVKLPQPQSPALVVLEQAGRIIDASIRTLQASQLLTVSITPDLVPAATLKVQLPGDGKELAGSIRLPVAGSTAALSVTLQHSLAPADPAQVLGDQSATISVTVVDHQGRPTGADLLLAVLAQQPIGALGTTDLLQLFSPTGQIAADTAAAQDALGFPSPAFWRSGLRTRDDGTLQIQVPLSAAPGRWRIIVLAASGVDLFGQAASTLVYTPPLSLESELPSYLRVGDLGLASLVLRNSSQQTRLISATLISSGLTLVQADLATQSVALPPGAQQRLSWPVVAATAEQASATFRIEGDGPVPQLETLLLPIRPATSGQIQLPPVGEQAAIALDRLFRNPENGLPLDPGRLRVGQLVEVQLTLVVVQPQQSVTIYEPLSAALEPLHVWPQAPFTSSLTATGELHFRAGPLSPGIYVQRYLARIVAPGNYLAPSPSAGPGDTATVSGASSRIIVE